MNNLFNNSNLPIIPRLPITDNELVDCAKFLNVPLNSLFIELFGVKRNGEIHASSSFSLWRAWKKTFQINPLNN